MAGQEKECGQKNAVGCARRCLCVSDESVFCFCAPFRPSVPPRILISVSPDYYYYFFSPSPTLLSLYKCQKDRETVSQVGDVRRMTATTRLIVVSLDNIPAKEKLTFSCNAIQSVIECSSGGGVNTELDIPPQDRPRPVLYLGAHDDDDDVRHLWALRGSIVCLSARSHPKTNTVLKKLPEGRGEWRTDGRPWTRWASSSPTLMISHNVQALFFFARAPNNEHFRVTHMTYQPRRGTAIAGNSRQTKT